MASFIHGLKQRMAKPKPLSWYVSAPLPIFAILTLIAVLTVVPRAMENLVKENAVDTAIELTHTLQKIRNYYAEHVLTDVRQQEQIDITHLHRISDNSIPLPATFLMEMAQSNSEEQKLKVTVTSPFPFESRKGREMTAFQQFAWQQLNEDPEQPVSQFILADSGHRVVKVALPDRLSNGACVACHNSHQDSQKNDWQLGDVRGIVEIAVDVESNLARAKQISFFIILISFVSLLLVVLFNLRLARKIVEPLSSITSAITALSERSFVSVKTKRNDYKEVTLLNDAFENLQGNEIKRQQLETEVHKLAYFDTLTQMPNRASMMKFLSTKLTEVSDQLSLNLIIVNLERFNEINDTLGYQVGDKALVQVAKRLEIACISGFVARFDSTEFAVAMVNRKSLNAHHIANNILEDLQVPVTIEGNELHLDISIGLAVIEDNLISANDAVTQANIALHQAQLSKSTALVTYTPDLSAELHERVAMIQDLKQALESGQLIPYFQPQLDLTSNKLVGAEVLLRWQKDDGTMIPPFKFIPIAERSRLIIPIGLYVLEQACRLTKQWQQQGLPEFRVAVNVSGVQFDEEDIVQQVQKVLNNTGLAAQYLELEVTETALMSDIEEIIHKLTELRALGLELAIDDFGTGYSSLSYLKKLPIHRLKIDQAFVRNIIDNKDDQAITEMILNLGHALNLKVLAEGVEGAAEESLLKSLGCDEVQGFYYAKPMPASEFEDYLKQLR